jgi:acyl-CoA synthetase (AMP-forming)/AMP-acid ligase II
MNIGYAIKRTCEIFPDHIAMIAGKERLTFREINFQANRFVNGLFDLNLRKGDRIGILLKNCREALEVILALDKGGMVRVPINPRLSSREVVYILKDSGVRGLIFAEDAVPMVEEIKATLPDLQELICLTKDDRYTFYGKVIDGGLPTEPKVKIDDEDISFIPYTSGTTGYPKGAPLTHKRFLMVNAKLLLEPVSPLSQDIMLHVAPLTAASNSLVLPHFFRGAANAIIDGPEFHHFFETVERIKATTTLMVPTLINMVLNHPALDQYDLSSLRLIYYGSAPMPQTLIRRALKKFGPIFAQFYGMAEALPVSMLYPWEHRLEGTPQELKRMSSAGRPCLASDMRIVNEKGEDITPGEVGEIIHKGDHVLSEYWQKPEATAESFREGWFYSGDMATFDEDGYIYFMDRKKDMIISGGYNIWPSEVESVLYQHEAVLEAAVVAIPDEKWGEVVKAVIVLKPGKTATAEEIINFCKSNLAGFKAPKSIDFTGDLPKNPAGKILRKIVRERYWEGQERRVH